MKRTTLHATKPVQPQGRNAKPLTLCGLKGHHHRMGFSAGHVTCGNCRKAILKQLRKEIHG